MTWKSIEVTEARTSLLLPFHLPEDCRARPWVDMLKERCLLGIHGKHPAMPMWRELERLDGMGNIRELFPDVQEALTPQDGGPREPGRPIWLALEEGARSRLESVAIHHYLPVEADDSARAKKGAQPKTSEAVFTFAALRRVELALLTAHVGVLLIEIEFHSGGKPAKRILPHGSTKDLEAMRSIGELTDAAAVLERGTGEPISLHALSSCLWTLRHLESGKYGKPWGMSFAQRLRAQSQLVKTGPEERDEDSESPSSAMAFGNELGPAVRDWLDLRPDSEPKVVLLKTLADWLLEPAYPDGPKVRQGLSSNVRQHVFVRTAEPILQTERKRVLTMLAHGYLDRYNLGDDFQAVDEYLQPRKHLHRLVTREGTLEISWPEADSDVAYDEDHRGEKNRSIYRNLLLLVLAERASLAVAQKELAHFGRRLVGEGEPSDIIRQDLERVHREASMTLLSLTGNDCGGRSEYSTYFAAIRKVYDMRNLVGNVRSELEELTQVVLSERERREKYVVVLAGIVSLIMVPIVLIDGLETSFDLSDGALIVTAIVAAFVLFQATTNRASTIEMGRRFFADRPPRRD